MYGTRKDTSAARADPRRRRGERCCCDWPGCEEEGDYPAPSARERLRDYRWFCLAHVREYNLRWDFFAGMSPEEIERQLRADVTWNRPTWRFASACGHDGPRIRDPFGFMDDGEAQPGGCGPVTAGARMMAVLGLEVGFTLDELKRRYKTLAKEHHPDLHGGDKAAEERLKSIIEAYRYLLEHRAYA
jgi:hypothetical protein